MDSPSLESCLRQLERKYPQAAHAVATALATGAAPLADKIVFRLTHTLMWALDQTPVLGQSAIVGFAELIKGANSAMIAIYAQRLRDAGRHGPAFADLMARHLPAVLQTKNQPFLKHFDSTVQRLRQIGAYTLTPTLDAFARILSQEDVKGARAYLTFLDTAASHPMTYNRCVRFCHVIPKGMARLEKEKRPWQIRQATRAVKIDLDLGDAFLEGMQNGLYRLNPHTLERFITFGLDQWRKQPRRGMRALALASRESITFLRQLSTSATFNRCRGEISRYLKARLGRSVPIRALAHCPGDVGKMPHTQVCSDGHTLYLPAETNLHSTYEQNHDHLLMLVRLETGLLEFGTFDFDRHLFLQPPVQTDESAFCPALDVYDSDLEWFVASFPDPVFAQNLLTLFEHGRIYRLTRLRYPGLHRRIKPLLKEPMDSILIENDNPLQRLYARIAVGMDDIGLPQWGRVIHRLFKMRIGPKATIHDVARFVTVIHAYMYCRHKNTAPFTTPFGRGVYPRLNGNALKLNSKNHRMQTGQLQPDPSPDQPKKASATSPAAKQAAASVLGDLAGDPNHRFHYPEWRADIDDYLPRHTTVIEQDGAAGDTAFYNDTLERYRPLVRHIRRVFEAMRPQQLNLLRPWKDGDAFDLTRLADYAISRRLRQTPPERLYIKRVKKNRNVAVQLLVDISRSTANPSKNSHRSVLEIEKEALVLFCESLYTLGDTFAIAGFSGKGRQQVYFRHIKKFDDPLHSIIYQRIGAIAPLQATRMGAAVRHAAFRLQEQPDRVRLLIVLGDGFPNDIDYKKEIAMADTRKAVRKAAAGGIHVHGITVNMAADSQCNDLYGPRHSIIADIRDLPAKLLSIYRQLTL